MNDSPLRDPRGNEGALEPAPGVHRRIAYFTMEVGLRAQIPTYSGGLGLLAGDALRGAADLGMPMLCVTLLHRSGYFVQRIDDTGWQQDSAAQWQIDEHARELPARVVVHLQGRDVVVRAWQHDVRGVRGHVVPVLFLDTDVEHNDPQDREITHWLYGGDHTMRLRQELVLGIAGVRLLRVLGHDVETFHMNEGHAAFLCAELLREQMELRGVTSLDPEIIARVRSRCVFTTHTPVPAGHDVFSPELVKSIVHVEPALEHSGLFTQHGQVHTTITAMNLSRVTNAVAQRHAEVSRTMFPGREIIGITNGVHAGFWASPAMSALFDRCLPGWREDSCVLRLATKIPAQEIAAAHMQAKLALLERVRTGTGISMDPKACTITFARRFTGYKRPSMVLDDLDRLRAIAKDQPLQVLFAGKAHPRDHQGKEAIQHVWRVAKELAASANSNLRIAFLPGYDIDLAKLLVSGSDVWLNNPEPPLEASGTSGMKAAVNGVPQVSTLDGWWLEACVEGVTGWSIGSDTGATPAHDPALRARHAWSLYDRLEGEVLPTFYSQPDRFASIRRSCIAMNGAYFNTHRMMMEYATRAYMR